MMVSQCVSALPATRLMSSRMDTSRHIVSMASFILAMSAAAWSDWDRSRTPALESFLPQNRLGPEEDRWQTQDRTVIVD